MSILGMHAHFKPIHIHIIYNVNTVHRIYGYIANPCIEERERERDQNNGKPVFSPVVVTGRKWDSESVAEQFQPVKIVRFFSGFPPQESGGSDSVVLPHVALKM